MIEENKECQNKLLEVCTPTVLDKQQQEIKQIVEALLFASSEALPLTKLHDIVSTYAPLSLHLLKKLILELREEYIIQQRAFSLEENAQGYLLRSQEKYSSYIDLLYRHKRLEKLSPAATEVLAIVAYKQPITKIQLEAIRGVDCSGSLQNLIERQLIECVGKLEVPGRPLLYGTTKEFLGYFGLKDITQLPKFLPNR